MSEFSKEYGYALYDLAKEEGKEEIILNEILEIDSLLKENDDYIKLMDTPALSLDERLKLIDDAFLGCSLYVLNFLKLLCEKKSFFAFPKCVKEFIKLYDKDRNIERVEAITCVPLNEDQLKRLKEKIEKAIGKTVCIKNKVDTGILGGVILKMENQMYDGSVKQRLDSLSAML